MTQPRDISRISPDAMALRALAHPQRMRMLGLLRMEGPATATGLAARLGLNSGATSYHLRQLARHGFIEEDAERGTGRDRWWRARHETTSVLNGEENEDALDAGIAFAQAALSNQIGQMRRALERHGQLSPDWRKASTISDFTMPMTAVQAAAVLEKLHAVLWEAMASAPPMGEPQAEGVEPVTFILHAFPQPPEDAAS